MYRQSGPCLAVERRQCAGGSGLRRSSTQPAYIRDCANDFVFMAFIYQVLRVVVLGAIAAAVDGLCFSCYHVVSPLCLRRWTHALVCLRSNTGLTYEGSTRNYDRQDGKFLNVQVAKSPIVVVVHIEINVSRADRSFGAIFTTKCIKISSKTAFPFRCRVAKC